MPNFDPGIMVSLDTETTGLEMWNGDCPFAVSMCNEDGDTWYCQWPVDPFTREVHPDPTELKFVKDVMENPSITKVMHNGKFDIRMLECNFGIKMRGRLEETLIAARVSDTDELSYGLKPLSKKYAGIADDDLDTLKASLRQARKTAKSRGWAVHKALEADYWMLKQIWPDNNDCEIYAVRDAERTLLLWFFYQGMLERRDVRSTYDREIELWDVVYRMETRGVRVDLPGIKREIAKHAKDIDSAVAEMRRLAGSETFNPNSAKQVTKTMVEGYGLIPTLKTDAGAYSMKYNSIRNYTDHVFMHHLMVYKAAEKVNKTCLRNYEHLAVPDPLNEGEYCIHPNYNQAAARTGRFSCNSPNLQQVVNSDGARNAVEPMNARLVFGPRPGYYWLAIDYSQLELRMFADVARELSLIKYIESGHDLHAECANKAWGGANNSVAPGMACIALEVDGDVTTSPRVQAVWDEYQWDSKHKLDRKAKDEFASWWLSRFDWDLVAAEDSVGKKVARTRAKFVMYAKIFGGGPNAIVGFLQCTRQEAQRFQFDYDKAFPRIPRYLKELMEVAGRDGYVTNLYGRKLTIDPNFVYKCVNYQIQSSAADFLKTSMVTTDRWLRQNNIDGYLLMTIHDELMFEISHKDFSQNMVCKLKELMEDHGNRFGVDLPTDASLIRQRWDLKEKLKY